MGHNNISIKFIVNKEGDFVPKLDDKGMLEAFINFEDPRERIVEGIFGQGKRKHSQPPYMNRLAKN